MRAQVITIQKKNTKTNNQQKQGKNCMQIGPMITK